MIVSMVYYRTVLDIDSAFAEDYIIDARDSRYRTLTDVEPYEIDGLTYTWLCEGVDFQRWCDNWAGSPILELPHNIAEEISGASLNRHYTITLLVSSIEAGRELSLSASLSDSFIWTDEKNRPEFAIRAPDYVYVTQNT